MTIKDLYKVDRDIISLGVVIQINSQNGDSVISEEFSNMEDLTNSMFKAYDSSEVLTEDYIVSHSDDTIVCNGLSGDISVILVIPNQDRYINMATTIVDEAGIVDDRDNAILYKSLSLIFDNANITGGAKWDNEYYKLLTGKSSVNTGIMSFTKDGRL
jgi:hypothetical protein